MTNEQWQIKRFVELEPSVASKEVIFQDKPDALICLDDGCIGIEHTRIIRPRTPDNDLYAFEKITDKILEQAQEIFSDERSEALQVSVSFDDRVRLTNRDRDEIARDLAQVALEWVSGPIREHRLEAWSFKHRGQTFPRAVESVYIDDVSGIDDPLWGADRGGAIPDLTPRIVQQQIDLKEAKLASYRDRCPEIWLLLVVEGGSPATYWSMHDFPFEHPFVFTFDRAFLYYEFGAQTWEFRRALPLNPSAV